MCTFHVFQCALIGRFVAGNIYFYDALKLCIYIGTAFGHLRDALSFTQNQTIDGIKTEANSSNFGHIYNKMYISM